MSQTRPKWLLTALIVVVVLGLSVVGYAAPPPDPIITGPTEALPVAVKQGNNVYATFDYTSAHGGSTHKGGDPRHCHWGRARCVPAATGDGRTGVTRGSPINTPVAEGTPRPPVISNHGLSDNINELDAVLVDNTPPGNFAHHIRRGGPPYLIEPVDAGTPLPAWGGMK